MILLLAHRAFQLNAITKPNLVASDPLPDTKQSFNDFEVRQLNNDCIHLPIKGTNSQQKIVRMQTTCINRHLVFISHQLNCFYTMIEEVLRKSSDRHFVFLTFAKPKWMYAIFVNIRSLISYMYLCYFRLSTFTSVNFSVMFANKWLLFCCYFIVRHKFLICVVMSRTISKMVDD